MHSPVAIDKFNKTKNLIILNDSQLRRTKRKFDFYRTKKNFDFCRTKNPLLIKIKLDLFCLSAKFNILLSKLHVIHKLTENNI